MGELDGQRREIVSQNWLHVKSHFSSSLPMDPDSMGKCQKKKNKLMLTNRFPKAGLLRDEEDRTRSRAKLPRDKSEVGRERDWESISILLAKINTIL